MRWLVKLSALVAITVVGGAAHAQEPRSRVITLECIAPPTSSPRGTPVLVRCRIKGQDPELRTAVALIDPFTPPYWETMDPFAVQRQVAVAQPFWEARSTLVDPFEPSAVELRDPFAPSEGEASDEP
jgi:hypothetical protein